MIPDLGKYTADVLAAYGITFIVLTLLVGASILHASRVKRRLQVAELERKSKRATSHKPESQNG